MVSINLFGVYSPSLFCAIFANTKTMFVVPRDIFFNCIYLLHFEIFSLCLRVECDRKLIKNKSDVYLYFKMRQLLL